MQSAWPSPSRATDMALVTFCMSLLTLLAAKLSTIGHALLLISDLMTPAIYDIVVIPAWSQASLT